MLFLSGRVVTESKSLFTYNPGQSVETFTNTEFVPVFDPLMLPFINMPGAAEVCGDSLECLFDIGSTGSISVGNITLAVQVDFNETRLCQSKVIHLLLRFRMFMQLKYVNAVICDPPCQNGAPCVSTNTCNCHPTFAGSFCEIGMITSLFSVFQKLLLLFSQILMNVRLELMIACSCAAIL